MRRASAFVFATVILLCAELSLPLLAGAQVSNGYHVFSYNAVVSLNRDADSLGGHVLMSATTRAVTSRVLQNAKYLTIDSVFVDGTRATFTWQDTAMGVYYVDLPSVLPIDAPFTLLTYYHGPARPEATSAAWGGVSDRDTMMFAMGVGFAVPYTSCTRHWLPCYDAPDDKADSVDLTFITKASDITASNGTLVSNTVNGTMRAMHWHEWRPIASYLLTFATGPYTEQQIPNSIGKPFEVFALQSDSAKARLEMTTRVSEALAFYDSLFGAYPFKKVGYVVTPIGSMEHQTMISLVQQALDTSEQVTTAVHELSHMWWGDWVTCQTFDDAWLNEGFATFSESLFLERFFGRSEYLKRQQANVSGAIHGQQLALFGAPSATHHANNYPYSTIYQKGAVMLGMIRDYLGDSVFFNALRFYGRSHAYSTATSNDLEQSLETSSGKDLGWAFRSMVYAAGFPKISVLWSPTSTGASLRFTQTQDTAKYPLFRFPLTILGTDGQGNTRRVRVWMDSAHVSTAFADFGFTPASITVDPDGLTFKFLTGTTLSVGSEDAKPVGELTIASNPVTESELRYTIRTIKPLVGTVVSLVEDAGGKQVRVTSLDTASSTWTGSLSVAGLAWGNYTLVVRLPNGETLVQKVSVQ